MMKKSIALCGFMGCGKSTVGKILAEKLNFDFFDSDAEIETICGASINEIFKNSGEDYFRQKECEIIKNLSAKNNAVISLGGGAILRSENLESLKNTIVVFIDTPFSLIAKRLKGDSSRPLIKNSNEDEISEIYTKRYPFYKSAADFVVVADEDPIKTADKIISFYGG